MTVIIDSLVSLLYVSFLLMLSAIFLGVAVFVVSLVIERFIVVTLPILTELYARIRYPDLFKEEE